MRLILVGGGTAGHINPALAIASYLRDKEPHTEILYVGAKGGMEEKLVRQENIDFRSITISGFSRKLNIEGFKKNIITLKNIFTASRESRKILDEFMPDICIGTGGYVSGPLLKEAYRKHIPFLIHEQNAYPGITNKLLSKKAQVVMLATKSAINHFKHGVNTVVTGNPLRSTMGKIDKQTARDKLNIKNNKPIILSFGGSLGARVINESIAELICWSQKNNLYNHIHAYGKYGRWMLDILKKHSIKINTEEVDIREYINNMSVCMAAADVVICRAGAITLSELRVCCKPSILIPSPNVTENHQYYNAKEFSDNKAGIMICEENLSGAKLIHTLSKIMDDLEYYKKGVIKLSNELNFNPNEKIYTIIQNTLKNSVI